MNIWWILVIALGATGIAASLLSCLVGLRQKVEVSMWWINYAIWIVIVLWSRAPSPFLTIVLASTLAGILHGTIQALLLYPYRKNNPWYEDQMQGPDKVLRIRFVASGVIIGAIFGAVIGGIALGIDWVF